MATTWRCQRDGRDRIYVVGDDDVTLGYVDVQTNTQQLTRLDRAAEFYEALAAWRLRAGMEREYTDEELAGLVCVECGVEYRVEDHSHVAVPTFEPGSLACSELWQLVACEGDCALRQSAARRGMSPYVEPPPLAERIAAWDSR
ncbi:hypothetical protein [Salinispora mooreana]|uniref:hypothetical protein n=1 Tax=Salinispora mooreana TaxID=999545 RepID=UPI00037297E8|nr:hypothetical protein [Salinispora mooreana]